jgi:hypothetical protein
MEFPDNLSNGRWRVTELAETNQHRAMVSGRARSQPHHADKLWCWQLRTGGELGDGQP